MMFAAVFSGPVSTSVIDQRFAWAVDRSLPPSLVHLPSGTDVDAARFLGFSRLTRAIQIGAHYIGNSTCFAGSPVAFGSLRSAIRKPPAIGGCAINSLTHRGTKTPSGHLRTACPR